SGGSTQFRLSVGGMVRPTDDPGSADVITALGFTEGTRSSVRQVVSTAGAFASGGAPAAGGSLLTSLARDGAPMGLRVGDAINVTGTRGDGSQVSIGLTVGATDTMDTLLARLNDPTSGFGAGARPATASLGPDGRLILEDGTGGDSRLSFAISVAPVGGGPATAAFGATTVSTTGRARELVRGSDAQVRVDGVLVTRPSNTIGDALAGVTLNLQQAEPGTTVGLTVTRDDDATVKAIRDFADAYNGIVTFLNGQQDAGAALALDSTLRRVVGSFTQALRTEAPGGGEFARGALAGLSLTRSGRVELNETTFRTALATNRSAVESLFGAAGIGGAMATAARSATQSVTGTIPSQVTSIDQANARARTRIATLQQRLDERREALVRQFTSLEQASRGPHVTRGNARGELRRTRGRHSGPTASRPSPPHTGCTL
ncbi:MAG: flagellar filament capping protein FliD, partial [Gemmatimonadaceae bacterium]|nr:flagellar filament capping protein FliD [Gemmatimonadaceae bacterium]